MSDIEKEFYYDIIVVGCGAAGLSAAVSALEQSKEEGKKISLLLIDRSDMNRVGGNTRYTTALMRMKSESELADNFVEDFLKFSEGKTSPEYVKKLAQEAPETLKWLKKYGVEFTKSEEMFIIKSRPRIRPKGGGIEIVDKLLLAAKSLGAEVFYETTAWKLSLDDEGNINGIYLRGKDGISVKVKTKAVVLACGGFEGNQEMLSKYMGREVYNFKPIAESIKYHRGECINMAAEIGAKLSGDFTLLHVEPVDLRAPENFAEPYVMVFPFGVLVDINGERFIDEASSTPDEIYEEVTRKIMYLPKSMAWLILSKDIVEKVPKFYDGLGYKAEPIIANTLKELAEKCNLPIDKLKETIERYNNSIVNNIEFDPSKLDGKGTKGITPPKSNWAVPIIPPFYAIPVGVGIVFTFGGLSTDLMGRVLSWDEVPIQGLYAAGEITGVYYGKYPGATSVLRSLIGGRITGKSAYSFVIKLK
jgi:Succinate dehydrogenase/fumarate reductase, flavoprotein subunit